MSDTSTIDFPKNRISEYVHALDHAEKSFSRTPLVDENTLKILGAVSPSAIQSTEPIHREYLRPITVDAQKALSEMHFAVVNAFIESSQAGTSAISSRPVQVSHFRDIPYRVARSEWHTLLEKLESLRHYEDGWNGYAAPAPNDTAINNAKEFLYVMRESVCIPTRVAASAVGGIGITRRKGPKRVYVELFNNDMVSALFADDAAQSMFTSQAATDWESYESLISDMKDYLSG